MSGSVSKAMHEHYMRNALNMARRGLGRTAPNPTVGCVIVKNDKIIARARTADKGRPHAETIALEQAGKEAKGATMYVTLQPCTHQGQTPPCADAITKAGIKALIVGASDPNPAVKGYPENIEVITGVLEQECAELNQGFFLSVTENRPFITLKTACTLDGKIACTSGESKWITGELARKHVHLVRSQHNAILVGKSTSQTDKPKLTTRLEGVEHNPLKIILGETEMQCDPHDLHAVLKELAGKGITRLLVEGGAQIHTSFLKAGLCDELLIYRAPTILGNENKSMLSEMSINALTERYDLKRKTLQILDDDVLETYQPKR